MPIQFMATHQRWVGAHPSRRNNYKVIYIGEPLGEPDSNGVLAVRVTRVEFKNGSGVSTDFITKVAQSRCREVA